MLSRPRLHKSKNIAFILFGASLIALCSVPPVTRGDLGVVTSGSIPLNLTIGLTLTISSAWLLWLWITDDWKRIHANDSSDKRQIYTKNDERFSNTLYRCQNDECSTRFFRMYQVFDAYKKGDMAIPGDNKIDEKGYAENLSPDVFAGLGLVACPNCYEKTETEARTYDWMKTEPAFPYLNLDALYAHRDAIYTNTIGTLNTNLAELSQKIKDIEEIGSYQQYYSLNTPHDAFAQSSIETIRHELETIRRALHEPTIQEQVTHLIHRLEQLDKNPFDNADRHRTATPNDKLDITRNYELERCLHSVIRCSDKWLSEQRKNKDDDLYLRLAIEPDYRQEIARITESYIAATQRS